MRHTDLQMSACVFGFALMPLMDERFVLQMPVGINHCGLVVHSNSTDGQTSCVTGRQCNLVRIAFAFCSSAMKHLAQTPHPAFLQCRLQSKQSVQNVDY